MSFDTEVLEAEWEREREQLLRKMAAETQQGKEQVDKLLAERDTWRQKYWDVLHNYNGVIGVVNACYEGLVGLGVEIPKQSGNPKADAVIAMNVAICAARGRKFLPYGDEVKLRAEIRALTARVAELTSRRVPSAEEALLVASVRDALEAIERYATFHSTTVDKLASEGVDPFDALGHAGKVLRMTLERVEK